MLAAFLLDKQNFRINLKTKKRESYTIIPKLKMRAIDILHRLSCLEIVLAFILLEI